MGRVSKAVANHKYVRNPSSNEIQSTLGLSTSLNPKPSDLKCSRVLFAVFQEEAVTSRLSTAFSQALEGWREMQCRLDLGGGGGILHWNARRELFELRVTKLAKRPSC